MAVQQQKENYQRILDKTIEQLGKRRKSAKPSAA